MKRTHWYADGLRFSCTQCGHCCRIEGHVWVDQEEIRRIASYLVLALDAFGRRFLRRVGKGISLTEKANRDCIFWEDGCSIYSARPRQCRTFPFWDQRLAHQVAWKTAASECKGIGAGRLYPLSEIESLRRGRGATGENPGDENG